MAHACNPSIAGLEAVVRRLEEVQREVCGELAKVREAMVGRIIVDSGSTHEERVMNVLAIEGGLSVKEIAARGGLDESAVRVVLYTKRHRFMANKQSSRRIRWSLKTAASKPELSSV